MLSKKLLLWTLALLCACSSMLSAQEMVFSTEPSANKVGLNDQFQVSFVLQNARNVSGFQAPSFKGFHVLAGPIQSSQSSYTQINGRMQQQSSIRLSYVLQAETKGSLTIDGATVTVDGQNISSNPVTIQVVSGSLANSHRAQRRQDDDPFADDPVFQAMQQRSRQIQRMMQQQMQQMQQQMGGGAPAMPRQQDMADMDEKNLKNNVFIKVIVDNTHPYVGQQITASYKLYARLPMNMNLTQLPSLNGFWSEDFNIPMPPKPTVEKINGKEYQVFLLKKSALFPQHAGSLILDPAKAAGIVRVIEQSKSQNSLADDPGFGSLFMNDPFFNNGYFSRYQYRDVRTELSSKPVTINVQELPVTGQPESFTGAVGHFTVHATLDSTVLYAGNSTNFTFTVAGSGNFKLIGSPVIHFPNALSAMNPLVTDTITGRSPDITGKKTFSYSLSPQEPGSYTIPAISFSYFDPTTKTYKTTQTRPVTLTVKAGKGNAGQNIAATKIADIHPNRTTLPLSSAGSLLFVASPLYWSIYLLAVILFGLALWWHKRKRDMAANSVLWKNKKANKVAWKRLAIARKLLPEQGAHTAFYEEVSKAVWLYLSDKLNIPLSGLSKENIAGKLNTEGVDAGVIEQTQNVISECEMALYSPSGGTKQRAQTLDNAAELIGALEEYLGKKKTEKHVSETVR